MFSSGMSFICFIESCIISDHIKSKQSGIMRDDMDYDGMLGSNVFNSS